VGLLRLELDIDADVYPELHATLTSLVSDASRGERLRQLAAAGLVWEKLRIRGQAALHGVAEAAPLTGPGGPAGPATAPAPAPRTRASASRAPAATRGLAPPVTAVPPRSGPPGFVDLALDAEPAPVPVAAAAAMPVTAPWPPVLMDVVDPGSFVTAMPIAMAEERSSRPMPPAPPVLTSPPSLPRAVEDMQDDSAPDPVLEPPIEHRSSTRSRLQRMKEKGLFKNG
jgi:hypothetical protein